MWHWKIIFAKQGKEIRIFYGDKTIRAYNKIIAEEVLIMVQLGKSKLY